MPSPGSGLSAVSPARGPRSASLAFRLWHSPTLNTWASFLSRSLGLVLVLPLVLKQFPAADFNVWSLFATLLGLQLLVDMGFCVTFVRAIALAQGGASSVAAFRQHAATTPGASPNWELVARVAGAMRGIYRRLALIFLVLLVVVGTGALWRPINLTDQPLQSWLAWLVVVATGYLNLRANYLNVFLQGLNEVALVRRWEAVTTLGSVLSGFVTLWLGGEILALICATQFWSVVAVLRNRWLCRQAAQRRFQEFPAAAGDPEIMDALWPATWRSGLGVLMSFGLIQFTGLIYAQFASAASSASYLLCLRLIQMISAFSQAPFYSKLPVLPRLRAEGKQAELLRVAEKGMRQSLWAYVLSFAGGGLAGPILLTWIGSNVAFPEQQVWLLLGVTFFAERYGAMHLNLYSTTNHIITHVANGVTALLCLGTVLLLWPWLGFKGLPAGLLAGYLAFYSWYPVRHSYREFGMPFWRFELRTSLGPLLCLGASVGAMLCSRQAAGLP